MVSRIISYCRACKFTRETDDCANVGFTKINSNHIQITIKQIMHPSLFCLRVTLNIACLKLSNSIIKCTCQHLAARASINRFSLSIYTIQESGKAAQGRWKNLPSIVTIGFEHLGQNALGLCVILKSIEIQHVITIFWLVDLSGELDRRASATRPLVNTALNLWEVP